MQQLIELWESFIIGAKNEVVAIFNDHVVLVAAILLFGLVFLTLYDLPRSRASMEKSWIGTIHNLLRMLLGFVDDFLNAINSLSNFFGVLRVMLMGKLTDAVQYFLSNYAIVFLSIASFCTTCAGLSTVVNKVMSLLLTFGIQAGILAIVTKLALLVQPVHEKLIQKVSYSICEEETSTPSEVENSPLQFTEKEVDYQFGKIGVLSVLLLSVMITSFYFSYVFLFNGIVAPNLPYEDYTDAVNMALTISEDYSEDLAEYQTALVHNLQKYNTEIINVLDMEINNLYLTYVFEGKWYDDEVERNTARISEYETEISRREEALEAERQDLVKMETDRDSGLLEETPQEEGLDTIIDGKENEIKKEEKEIEKLREELKSVQEQIGADQTHLTKLAIMKSILTLDAFYANPMYFLEENHASADELQENYYSLRRNLAAVVETELLGTSGQNSLDTIFGNYVMLCEYYQAHGKKGADKTKVNGAVNAQPDVLKTYRGYGKKEEGNNYLNEESARVLLSAIEMLSEAPVFDTVGRVWSDIEIPVVPLRDAYISEIYRIYRDSSGQVSSMERAVTVLFKGRNRVLCFMLLILAVFIDSLIVILSFLKGRRSYSNRLPRLRRIIAEFFLSPEFHKAERRKAGYMKEAGALGVTTGIILFVIYYIFGGNENELWIQYLTLLVLAMGGMAVGKAICSMIWHYEGGEEDESELKVFQEKDADDIMDKFTPYLSAILGDTETRTFNKIVEEYLVTESSIFRKERKLLKTAAVQVTEVCIAVRSVKEAHMQMAFYVLQSEGLIKTDISAGKPRYYILTEHFIRLLNDCIVTLSIGAALADDAYIANDLFDLFEESDEDE